MIGFNLNFALYVKKKKIKETHSELERHIPERHVLEWTNCKKAKSQTGKSWNEYIYPRMDAS
jgi:hypothetical protein